MQTEYPDETNSIRQMKNILFSVPIYKYKVKNWDIKKKKLLDLFNSFEHRFVGNVITSPINIKTDILLDEILSLENETGFRLNVEECWFQKYENMMNHGVHTHGVFGFSSVCFIEYNKNFHKPTTFVSPFISNISGEPAIVSPDVEEGDIIFFPSNILHYVPVNSSKKERLIISFNLSVDRKYVNKSLIKYQ